MTVEASGPAHPLSDCMQAAPPAGAAERIAQADPNLFMRIADLELPATTEIGLGTTPDGAPANWQTLPARSTGRKATAVPLLLPLESEVPPDVDQPEDDCSDRFITNGMVPIMQEEKQRRRQFVFSTHNAGFPALGDAERILGFAAIDRARGGQGGSHRSTWPPSIPDPDANWSKKSLKTAGSRSRCAAPSTVSEK